MQPGRAKQPSEELAQNGRGIEHATQGANEFPCRPVARSHALCASEEERAARKREERIADIRRRIESGTYEIDPDELSRAIVQKHIKKAEPKS